VSGRILLNAITGETIFEFRAQGAASAWLAGDFGAMHPRRIALHWEEGRWRACLFLLPGRYQYRLVVDGISHANGVVEVRLDFRSLPDEVLRRVALTHTCGCHPQKWN